MYKYTSTFAVETRNGIVQKIGKSTIYLPTTNYNGKGIKWFDDSKLLKDHNSGSEVARVWKNT